MYFNLDEEQKNQKILKELDEMAIQMEAAKRELEAELEKKGIDLEQLIAYFSNEENFTKEEWAEIQNRRNELKKEMDNVDKEQSAITTSHRKPLGEGWVFCG